MDGKANPLRLSCDTLLLCILDAQIEAGLGNPPNKFDNQRAQSINLVAKENLDHLFTDQTSVHTANPDKLNQLTLNVGTVLWQCK